MITTTPDKSLSFRNLEDYCDSLERRGEIQVILYAERKRGYAMRIDDGTESRVIVDSHGMQLWFRTVDQALEDLADVPYLSENLIIVRSSW
ncbi:hypothetical protein ABQZ99_018185 [Xanthomonas hortorum pv. vitians]|uniref:hypothetical protein n=1 Tax=Xanthomonas hortorum TaxID=56454 RepID=UPI0001FD68C9|nr:hypothetical protein [Xanthomonas hortorum]MCC4626503.1 hypothetical protein [Xanthomonas campestris pv. nigromaculans]APP79211.1 hypothetical protein BJD10_05430 [Xanthomonas hortorum pv. gardneri]APP86492.1 hypothetical protein BI317_22545 [Xanthomonas hortorum pv. gardneri]EGD20295.1 hypothetical protein XGA_1020 [Xanthomonas hortorum ATCC 19865]KLA94465.1 hypothetical protein SM17710_19600 [Xanthomonas hortorum pv. gardneri]